MKTSVPFMITKQMRIDLINQDKKFKNLLSVIKPEEAHNYLKGVYNFYERIILMIELDYRKNGYNEKYITNNKILEFKKLNNLTEQYKFIIGLINRIYKNNDFEEINDFEEVTNDNDDNIIPQHITQEQVHELMRKDSEYSEIVSHITKEEYFILINNHYNIFEEFVLIQKIKNRKYGNISLLMTPYQISEFEKIGDNIKNQSKYITPIISQLVELGEYQSNEYEQKRIEDYFPEMFRPGLN